MYSAATLWPLDFEADLRAWAVSFGFFFDFVAAIFDFLFFLVLATDFDFDFDFLATSFFACLLDLAFALFMETLKFLDLAFELALASTNVVANRSIKAIIQLKKNFVFIRISLVTLRSLSESRVLFLEKIFVLF